MSEQEIATRLERIELLLTRIIEQEPPKECYSTTEIAKTLGKAEFTV